jgi:hypothetical protein
VIVSRKSSFQSIFSKERGLGQIIGAEIERNKEIGKYMDTRNLRLEIGKYLERNKEV